MMNVVAHERFRAVEINDAPVDDRVTAAGAATISVRGLEKDFGANRVLRGIDLDIPAGQFVAIIGKSGCGKSTLLRLLSGLDAPTGGSFSFQSLPI